MSTNIKIITPDVSEILDTKILASNPHVHLNVSAGEDYDSVLAKIAARTPTLAEKQALDASLAPSGANPFITLNQLTTELAAKIPWKTIGPAGSGADFQGNDQAAFQAAFTSGGSWFQVREGTYTFTSTLSVPTNVRLVGTSAIATIIQGSFAGSVLSLASGVYLAFMSVTQTTAAQAAVVANDDCSLENLQLSAPATGQTLLATSRTNIKIFECASLTGSMHLDTVTDSFLHGCFFNAPAVNALNLTTCTDVVTTSSIFSNGFFACSGGTNIRAVSNHFAFGTVVTTSTIVLRANTPKPTNNEEDDFSNLLAYIGSPSVNTVNPPYSNNFAGPIGQDLTARASALDLLLQWRYEERNFHLVAETEVTTVTWSPSTNNLSTSGNIHLVSSHRVSYWNLPTLTNVNIPTGNALYYVLDRTLNNTPITLTPVLAPLGSIPLDSSNRQIFVMAFAQGSTLWWRGGRGTRFPATANQTGTFFVDGSSKSLLDFLGAADYNDSDPAYSSNFAGIQSENLTTRLGKTDTLIKRLYEYTNVGINLSDAGFISVEAAAANFAVTLSGTMSMAFPQVAGHITATNLSWNVPDGSFIYFTFDQGSLAGIDTAITSSAVAVNGTLPLPNAYPLTTKYFVFGRRVGSDFFLWDGTNVPVGGRYPVPIGRAFIPTNLAVTLSDNIVWDGTNLLWEKLNLAVSTGQVIGRNAFGDQVTASAGLTDLTEGTGLVVTHSWNAGVAQTFLPAAVNTSTNVITLNAHGFTNGTVVTFSSTTTLPSGLTANTPYYIISATTNTFQVSAASGGAPTALVTQGTGTHSVLPSAWSVQKVTIPLVNALNQNQFLWVQRRGGVIVFST